jgi:TolB-like protein
VVVLNLVAKDGVKTSYGEQLSAVLVTRMRQSRRFEKVVSAQEMEALLAFSQQRELLVCESDSCTAEIAGALGVRYLVSGTIGRFGSVWLLNLRLLDTKTAQADGTVSRTIPGDDEALLAAVAEVTAELLRESSILAAPQAAEAPEKPKVAAASPAGPTAAVKTAQPTKDRTAEAPAGQGPPVPAILRGVGAVFVVAGLVPGILLAGSTGVGVAALLLLVVPAMTYVPALARLRLPLVVVTGGGVAGAVVSLALVVLAAGAAVGSVASSFVVE